MVYGIILFAKNCRLRHSAFAPACVMCDVKCHSLKTAGHIELHFCILKMMHSIPLNSHIWRTDAIPVELLGSITQPCWNELCDAATQPDVYPGMMACGIEVLLCAVTGY